MFASNATQSPIGIRGSGFLCLLVGLAITCSPRLSRADVPATALMLRDEGSRLLRDGKVDEACPKLAESHRLQPAIETLMDLAVCHETQGLTATAWAEFRNVEAWGHRTRGSPFERLATKHLQDLRPRLCELTVRVSPEGHVPDMEITLDGADFGEAAWNMSTPVNPGRHEVIAQAPGYRRLVHSISLKTDSRKRVLFIELSKVVAVHNTESVADEEGTRALRSPIATVPTPKINLGAPHDLETRTVRPVNHSAWIANGMGILGVSGIVVGSIYGIRAYREWNAYSGRCPYDVCADASGQSHARNAKWSATVSDVSFGVGLTASAIAAFLYYRDQNSEKRSEIAYGRILPTVQFQSSELGIGFIW